MHEEDGIELKLVLTGTDDVEIVGSDDRVFDAQLSRTVVHAAGRAVEGPINSPEPPDRDWLALAVASFAEDWGCPEDSAYDDV